MKGRHVSVRLTDEDADALDRLAERDDTGVSTLVRIAIRAYLRSREEELTSP